VGKQRLCIGARPLIYFAKTKKLFDKLTVKPNSSESAAAAVNKLATACLKNNY